MNKSIDFSNISQAALNAAETLLAGWLPNGKRDGHEYKALNPTRADMWGSDSFCIGAKRDSICVNT